MLHLANGQAALERLRDAQMPGNLRSADEILMEGPLRNGLARAEDWSFRAEWLDARMGIPRGDYLVAHARLERAVRAAADATEVVVWSEPDLFCQVNLAYVLHRLDGIGTRVTLACPDDGRIGRMAVDAVQALFAARRPVEAEDAARATRTWRAFASPDPTEVERLLPELAEKWPAMHEAARLHLKRFPWTRDGLGALQRALLQATREHPGTFEKLYEAASARADVEAFGIGDAQAHGILRQLAEGDAPLLGVDDPRALDDPLVGGVWRVTDAGRHVLDGAADAVALRGADTWIGGVRLEGARVWRWEDDSARLVPPA